MITDPCSSCRGQGRIKDKRSVHVQIPAGVDSGMRLKMEGYGDAGQNGAPAGDLYVFIDVEAHPVFERRGDDLILELPIGFVDAALGMKKEVPTLLKEGLVASQCLKGFKAEQFLRLKIKDSPTSTVEGVETCLYEFL